VLGHTALTLWEDLAVVRLPLPRRCDPRVPDRVLRRRLCAVRSEGGLLGWVGAAREGAERANRAARSYAVSRVAFHFELLGGARVGGGLEPGGGLGAVSVLGPGLETIVDTTLGGREREEKAERVSVSARRGA